MTPITIRKHKSDSSKRKRIKGRDKFVFNKGSETQCSGDIGVDVDNNVGVEENVKQSMETQTPSQEDVDIVPEENIENQMEEPFEVDIDVNVEETMDPGLEGNDNIPNIFDPKNWDNLAPKLRDLLVKKGPLRDVLTGKGPKNGSNNRRFTSKFYIMHLSNVQKHHRDWLVYCKDLDRVFCFYYKVFKTKRQFSQLAHDGIREWGHLSHSLMQHE
ncbi:zinc finger MYM-type protein 5-like [Impatiens glandulifera]|uniref:zinc finger MYM-type protein 5-like n=1 Tax=Impatiens glandulifera TaxID=253017 RepID=UPI001FB1424E|nr:zinc finger MYM-type protein 5-like [Impatiens glandulifera]